MGLRLWPRSPGGLFETPAVLLALVPETLGDAGAVLNAKREVSRRSDGGDMRLSLACPIALVCCAVDMACLADAHRVVAAIEDDGREASGVVAIPLRPMLMGGIRAAAVDATGTGAGAVKTRRGVACDGVLDRDGADPPTVPMDTSMCLTNRAGPRSQCTAGRLVETARCGTEGLLPIACKERTLGGAADGLLCKRSDDKGSDDKLLCKRSQDHDAPAAMPEVGGLFGVHTFCKAGFFNDSSSLTAHDDMPTANWPS